MGTDIKIGRYKHFKGGEYKVVCVAMDADTLERRVVYQGLYHNGETGDHPIFVRSLAEFTEVISRPGYEGLRFSYLGEDSFVCKDCGKRI
jgi:hypothetical protein